MILVQCRRVGNLEKISENKRLLLLKLREGFTWKTVCEKLSHMTGLIWVFEEATHLRVGLTADALIRKESMDLENQVDGN